MEKLLDIPEWNGLVVVDEAYIDFSDIKNTSMLSKVAAGCKNVVVLQTLSKAFGLAGIRWVDRGMEDIVAKLCPDLASLTQTLK